MLLPKPKPAQTPKKWFLIEEEKKRITTANTTVATQRP